MFVIGLFTFKNIKLKFVIFVPLVSPNSIAKILWQASLWFHWCYSKILIFRYFPLRLHRFNISAVTVRVFWPYWDWVTCTLVITYFVSWHCPLVFSGSQLPGQTSFLLSLSLNACLICERAMYTPTVACLDTFISEKDHVMYYSA